MFSVKLEKWSFHVTDLPRTGKKFTERKKKHVKLRACNAFSFVDCICKICSVVEAVAS